MSKGRQYVTFHGLMEENVLGTFRIIRGFATLSDLAEVSEAMPYSPGSGGVATGYQRHLDEQHVCDLKTFLDKGRYRFFPEIVLSLRSSGADDPVVAYVKRRQSPNDNACRIRVSLKELRQRDPKCIWRIDGNHRLEAARQLDEERRGSSSSSMTAPFCFVVLDPNDPEQCELDEAMLFNLINNKALPLVSEHSLQVLMRDDGSPPERFSEDPQLYLTRAIKDRIQSWPNDFYGAMGREPLSRLHATAGVLLRPGGIAGGDREGMEREVTVLFAALHDLASRLRAGHERFVLSYAFLPVAAEVYARHTGAATGTSSADARLARAESWLAEFAKWFDRVGGADLPLPADPSALWHVFKRQYDQKAGQVFVAMSFSESRTLNSVFKAIEEAINQHNLAHPNATLAPLRMDRQKGASYEIPARVFHEIDGSCLIIADLTEEKQNVYCEVGYAKARGKPFFLTFNRKSEPPNRVHFDLAPHRCIRYDDPLDLRNRLREELAAWFASV